MTNSTKLPLWLAILLTVVMVITVRESAVVICESLGIGQAANIVAMVVMFLLLVTCRAIRGLALGLAAHAFGTVQAWQMSRTAGRYAAFGLAVNGLVTAVLVSIFISALPL